MSEAGRSVAEGEALSRRVEEAPSPVPVVRVPDWAVPDPYSGIGAVSVSPDQKEVLLRQPSMEQFDILPTGEVYISQVYYRRVLCEVFNPLGWGMRPMGPPTLQDDTVMREWGLYVQGRFVSSAVGKQEYQPLNDRMSYADALEGAKSNALMRCCKDLGIASECWDHRFQEQFRNDCCVLVRVKVQRQNRTSLRPQWRLKAAAPFENEVWGDDAARDDVPERDVRDDPKPTQQAPAPALAPAAGTPMGRDQALPSHVFKAGRDRGWMTRELDAFVQRHFRKHVTELARGEECTAAIAAIVGASGPSA